MALAALSVAFPAEAPAIAGPLRDWFDRSEPPVRTGLGLVLAYHGLADEAIDRIVTDEVGQSLKWAIRTDKFTAFTPNPSPFPQAAEEPYIDSPVPEAIRVAARLRSGADEQTRDFFPVFSFLMTLMDSAGHLIDSPG